MQRWLAAVVIALGLAVTGGVQAASVGQPVTPEELMPGAQDLPVGFVEDPAEATRDVSDYGTLVFRRYSREGSPPGLSSVADLAVGVGVSPDSALAATAYGEIVEMWQHEGRTTETPSVPLGEQAVIARSTEQRSGVNMEVVSICFRNGPVLGFVVWSALPGLPNVEGALSVAQPLSARTRAYAEPTPAGPTAR